MSERDWHLIPELCSTLIKMIADAKAEQTIWLAQQGLTWDQARALSKTQQDELQALFTQYRRNEP